MNQKILKKVQLNKLKNIFKNMCGMELVELLDMDEEKVYEIKSFLRDMSKYSYLRIASIESNSNKAFSNWVIENLKFLKNCKEIIAIIDNCNMWLCRVKIVDINLSLEELWEMGDICFFEMQNNAGVYIGPLNMQMIKGNILFLLFS